MQLNVLKLYIFIKVWKLINKDTSDKEMPDISQ